jgi:hypothetical protein
MHWDRVPDHTNDVGETAWSILNYGQADWCIAAVEATDPVHAVLAAKADVIATPADLDTGVTNQRRDAVRSFMEEMGMPGNWVAATTPWREVIRTISGMALLGKRYDGIKAGTDPGAPSLGSMVRGNLNTQWRSIPQGVRDTVMEAGQSMNMALPEISDTDTVRNILKQMADVWGGMPVSLGLEEYNGGTSFAV